MMMTIEIFSFYFVTVGLSAFLLLAIGFLCFQLFNLMK